MRLVIFVLGMAAAAWVQAATCAGQSSEATTVVLELYTSDSCAACPATERWLADFKAAHAGRDGFLPIVLRFDTADYTQSGVDRPQRKLTPRQRLALLHTPRLLLQGREVLRLDAPQLEEAIRAINARRARARIRLELSVVGESALRLAARAQLPESGDAPDLALYLAAYEARQEGYRVLEWQGPFAFAGGRAEVPERELALLPGAVPAASGALGLVQDRRSGEILQAVNVPAC